MATPGQRGGPRSDSFLGLCIASNAKGPRGGSLTICDASLHFGNKMDNTICDASQVQS